jgi:transcriptional regulator with XRE-family HTH domain
MNEKISDILYMARHKLRESQPEAGKKAGCSTVYLSGLETGKYIPLDGVMLNRLAKHYGIDFENLIRTAYNQKCEEIIQKYKGATGE